LGPAQILDRLPEVAARGVGDAAYAVPVRRDAEVVREYRRVPVARGERERRERLDELPRVGPRSRALQARHLHGDGRRARGAPPGARLHRRSAGGATSRRAPAEFPCTLPSYISSACAAGWMKRPPVAARARK